MWASPKSDYFLDVAAGDRKWIADFVVMTRRSGLSTLYHDLDCALHSLDAAGLTFPLMAKPDIGCRGHGVRRIDNRAALRDYLRRFPGGARLILQRFVPDEGEAAVFYARLPGEDRGRILSLTFRYFPHVIGDGRHSVRALIYSDPRAQWKALLHLGYDPNHRGLAPSELERIPARGEVVQIALIGDQRVGGLYRDGRRFITSELETRIDIIARGMSEFHYGRFDLRFASVEELMRGEGISIVDIDGIGSEAIDAWDPLLSIAEAYRRLIDQQRIFFVIGERNRGRGVKPTGLAEFLKLLVRQNWLIRRYPASS